MRLERHNQSTIERAGGIHHRRQLRRVMAVVVDDQNAPCLAAYLESTLRADEVAESRRDGFEGQPQLETDRDGGQRVQQVVSAGHPEREGAQSGWRLERFG